MVIAVANVVLEVIALVFQRVERFIVHAPAGSRPLHDSVNRALVDPQVRDPTAMLDFPLHLLPALDAVDPQGGIGGMERHVTDKTKPMLHALLSLMTLIRGHAPCSFTLRHLLAPKRVITFLHSQNIPHALRA